MKISKQQRQEIFNKYGGQCAYCGAKLTEKWHADHFNPIVRKDNGCERTENNCFENLMPACAPCKIDKATRTIDEWRQKLQNATNVLLINNSAYRHALRYGLIIETGANVKFYFERLRAY